jgi:chromosome segregation ATPase
MSINVKKYTKDQMAKMVEEAAEKQEAAEAEAAAHFKDGVKLAEENEKLRGEIAALTEQIDRMNGEAITRENVIANLKADNDILRGKARYAEAALGRANAEVSRVTVGCRQVEEERDYMHQKWSNAEQRANYAEAHPWKNLWAWAKRKMVRHE